VKSIFRPACAQILGKKPKNAELVRKAIYRDERNILTISNCKKLAAADPLKGQTMHWQAVLLSPGGIS